MIEIRDLCKQYGKLKVLDNISLDIKKGEVVSIIGPSGSGKTTFIRCLNLLEIPTSGTIKIKGETVNTDHKNINRFRANVGMVFQQFNLFVNKTVLENLTLAPRKVLKLSEEAANDRARELLALIGLEDKYDNYPVSLSGGQKQRIAIARALAMEPEILLFDEPTSSLDPEMVGEVLQVMKKLTERDITMVVVTHEMGFAKNVSSRTVMLDEGKVIEANSSLDFFTNPKNPRTINFLNKVLHHE